VAGAAVFSLRSELLAIQVAKDMGVARLLVETDCMGAKAKITGSEMDRSMHGQLVEEIKAMLQGFEDYKVQHVNRKCNEVAHLIAKDNCDNKSYNTWVDSPPGIIVDSLALDYANV
jgi:hypothetical protein